MILENKGCKTDGRNIRAAYFKECRNDPLSRNVLLIMPAWTKNDNEYGTRCLPRPSSK